MGSRRARRRENCISLSQHAKSDERRIKGNSIAPAVIGDVSCADSTSLRGALTTSVGSGRVRSRSVGSAG
eukprot:2456942-Pleurochrysis_carterae.AAC.2